MELRQMTASDVFVVADIERKCFSEPWSADSFFSALKSKNQVFIVLEDEGNIAGYCGMLCVLDEGQILNVAVDENYRRRGFGTEMIRSMLSYGIDNGLSLYTLEVRAGNLPAIALYASCGFRAVGMRKEYYNKPKEDALLMELDLTAPETAIRFGVDVE